ncbi:MAG: preprotein translocase subunit SecG [Planctomycetes bacterium]|nr:preprotein translocase subunit SecG [Planctomycetota bacterium]
MTGLLYIVFIASCILLIGIILIQEGKGGGLSDAFGGLGGETFGHRAGPVTKITGFLAAVMIVSLIALHKYKMPETSVGLFQDKNAPTVNQGLPPGGNSGNQNAPPESKPPGK